MSRSAYHKEEILLLRLEDDGRAWKRKKIEKAINMGIVSTDAELSEKESDYLS
jgi:chemotaxis protein histidine kinase CheA